MRRKFSWFVWLVCVCGWLVGLGPSFGCGCGPGSNNPPVILTDLKGEPPELIFAEATQAKPEVQSFLLFNGGSRDLKVEELRILEDETKLFSLVKEVSLPFILKAGRDNGVTIRIRMRRVFSGYAEAKLSLLARGAGNTNANGFFLIKLRTPTRRLLTDLLNPDRPQLIFTQLEPNEPRQQSFLVYMEGERTLKVGGMKLVNNRGNVFSILEPKGSFELKPGKSLGKKITIQAQSSSPKDTQAILALQVPDADNAEGDGFYSIQLAVILPPLEEPKPEKTEEPKQEGVLEVVSEEVPREEVREEPQLEPVSEASVGETLGELGMDGGPDGFHEPAEGTMDSSESNLSDGGEMVPEMAGEAPGDGVFERPLGERLPEGVVNDGGTSSPEGEGAGASASLLPGAAPTWQRVRWWMRRQRQGLRASFAVCFGAMFLDSQGARVCG